MEKKQSDLPVIAGIVTTVILMIVLLLQVIIFR